MPHTVPHASTDGPSWDASQKRVLVGVCTFRRPEQLVRLLTSLDEQELPDDVAMTVLVVDNSPDLEARTAVEQFAARTSLTVLYAAHGAGDISSGRNEVLRRIPDDCDLVAFIDDDEVADPRWLSVLVAAQSRSAADVVTGPVLAVYPPHTPGWLQSDLLYSVTGPREGGFVEEAVTGNALIRAATVRELRLTFDVELGLSGGEDQLFFRTARALGARLWFEPDAVVRETVPKGRLALRYLLRREYRKGNTLGLLDRSRPDWPAGDPRRRALKAVYWAVTGALAVLASSVSRDRRAAAIGLMRVARAAGMITGLRGSTFAHYQTTQAMRPMVATVVVQEDPAYQHAGHSQYLAGFIAHCSSLGMRVVVVVTEGRLGFVHRRASSTVYRAPGLVDIAGRQVVIAPRLLAGWAAWSAFRAAPRWAQAAADRLRTAARSGRSIDHRLGRELDPVQAEHVRRVLLREQPDIMLFSGPFSVPRPLPTIESVKATIMVCHDVVSARADDFRAHGFRVTPPDYDETTERAAMTGMSAVVAIQWDEADVLRRMVQEDVDVLVCPVAVAPRLQSRAPAAGSCLFVGSGSLPNVEGLRWFLDHCWSRVREARPDALLHVVGTVCPRVGPVPTGVVLLGEVADLTPHYAAAAVVVVPLRTGSGLKVKIIEAISHGAAVVTTTVGAQGLSRLTPRPFIVADEPDLMAAAVVDVLSRDDVRSRLEDAARRTAPSFAPDRVFRELDDHLRRRQVLPLTTPGSPSSVVGRDA